MEKEKEEILEPLHCKDFVTLATAWVHEGAGCGAHPKSCQCQPCFVARQILRILGLLHPAPTPSHKTDTCLPCEAVRREKNTQPRKSIAKRKQAPKSRKTG
jgi:hypothetical protein